MTWLLYLFALLFGLETASDDEPDDEREDDPDEPDNDEDDEPDEDEDLTEEQLADIEATRDPKARIKALMQANARLAKKVSRLESGTSNGSHALRDARIGEEFMREAIRSGHVGIDLDAAWDLGHAKKIFDRVQVKADGTVKGMDRAFETILSRYPYLADDADDDGEHESRHIPKPKTGTARKKKPSPGISQDALKERFPSLRKPRRRSI